MALLDADFASPPRAAYGPHPIRSQGRVDRRDHMERHAGSRRVAIVDSSPVIRDGLPLLLPQFSFVGSYDRCESLVHDQPDADVVLLDLHLAHLGSYAIASGVDAIVTCRRAGYAVCLYSHERRDRLLLRCLGAGATGIVSKNESTIVLAQTIEQVSSGAMAISAAFPGLAELTTQAVNAPSLSNRQAQVLAARARGKPFRNIARSFSISEKTAQEHWAIISVKFAAYLQQHSAADLERALGLDQSELFWHME